MRRRLDRAAADPAAAARWREYAGYLARIPDDRVDVDAMSDAELREHAEQRAPALPWRGVLDALDKARDGEPYGPYSRSAGARQR